MVLYAGSVSAQKATATANQQTHFIRYIGFYSDIQTKGKYRIAKKTFNMFVAICLMCERVLTEEKSSLVGEFAKIWC